VRLLLTPYLYNMQNNKETMEKLYQYLTFDIIGITTNENCKMFMAADAYIVRMKYCFSIFPYLVWSITGFWASSIV
jgi:hypothetical protein